MIKEFWFKCSVNILLYDMWSSGYASMVFVLSGHVLGIVFDISMNRYSFQGRSTYGLDRLVFDIFVMEASKILYLCK